LEVAKMACKSATFDLEDGRYQCSVSGDGCMFLIPDSKACAERYGEGPDADYGKCEDCKEFYVEDEKRCCRLEPLRFEGTELIKSKYIEDEVTCCGGFKERTGEES
jgi:hypothetical protein